MENNVVKCLHFNENALNSELKRMWRRILRQQVKVDIKRATSRKSSNLQLQNSTKLEKRIKKGKDFKEVLIQLTLWCWRGKTLKMIDCGISSAFLGQKNICV